MPKMQEVVLVYRKERIRFDGGDVAILECDEIVKAADDVGNRTFASSCGGLNALLAQKVSGVIVKAECPPDELIPGLSYRFYGHWVEHPRHGNQFHARTYVRVEPHGKAGVIRYLTSICAGHGVGHATANALWEKFGGNAVKILREEPEVAVAAAGMSHFTDEKAAAASAVLKRESALEETQIDLVDLLGGRGFPRNTAKQAVAEWGNRAATMIRKNPYLLMRFRGCGFSRTDQLYMDQGGKPAALKRQALAAWHAIAKDSEGHTWFRTDKAEHGIRGRVAGAATMPVPAVLLAKRAHMLSVCRDATGTPWLAERKKADNEQFLAGRIREMLESKCQWPDVSKIDATEHQRRELSEALQRPLGAFGGGPGTGKTYTSARLISRVMDLCGDDEIAVCAPTGKAGVRITEALAEYHIQKTATTIHRLLGVASHSAGDGWCFAHNADNPLPQKYYVIDEGSMVDCDLMAAFFRALPRGAHLLIVGDVYQLPPVGHGAPLRDILAANVPAGELREIHRNAGSIVKACKAIREGRPWAYDKCLDPDAGHNLILEETRSNAASADAIIETLRKLPEYGLDPVWDTQVLVSINKRSELSRTELNKRLQAELNPAGKQARGCPFRVDDKVIRVKRNSLMPCAENSEPGENPDAVNGKVLVCNGEMGRVVGVEEKRAFAVFGDRRIVIPFGRASEQDDDSEDSENATTTGCDFDLGYACTVHKFQGSECPVVLWGLDESGGAMRLGCRELFYTGLSRAKIFAKHFGKKWTADAMCTRRSIMRRKTFLKERILGEVK